MNPNLLIAGISLTLALIGIIFFWYALRKSKKEGREEAFNEVEAQATKAALAQTQTVYEKQEKVRAAYETISDILSDTWPVDGVIELHKKSGSVSHQFTSAHLLDPRD